MHLGARISSSAADVAHFNALALLRYRRVSGQSRPDFRIPVVALLLDVCHSARNLRIVISAAQQRPQVMALAGEQA